MTTIEGTTALVTGGQRGLGRAIADRLLERGAAKVIVTAREPATETRPRVEVVALDVTEPGAVDAVAARAGDVEIVVNNAGVLHPSPLLAADMDDVLATFDTNVFGPLRVARAFAPVLAANGGGVLVDMHSVLSWAAGAGAYGASKAALWSLTNSLRIELAAQRTRVVGVHLGYADTDMTTGVTADKLSPARVADAVVAGIEDDADEVLVDDVSRSLKAALSGPVSGLSLALGR